MLYNEQCFCWIVQKLFFKKMFYNTILSDLSKIFFWSLYIYRGLTNKYLCITIIKENYDKWDAQSKDSDDAKKSYNEALYYVKKIDAMYKDKLKKGIIQRDPRYKEMVQEEAKQ